MENARRWPVDCALAASAGAGLGLLLLLAACSSEVNKGDPGGSGPGTAGSAAMGPATQSGNGLPSEFVSGECRAAGAQPGPTPIRRLTRHEYDHTVEDLLGDASAPARDFTDEEVGLGYTNNADVQTVSDLLAEQYETAALQLAARATEPSMLGNLLGCDAAALGQDACARSFIEGFGKRAYRRPLEAQEIERLFQFYATSAQAYGFEAGVRMVLEAMLQSPHFLYRVEQAPPDGAVRRVNGYEAAVRLSYLLWSSLPDAALFDAAASGALDTPEGVTQQAERMLQDPKINRAVGRFFEEWLELETLGRVSRDATLFPTFTSDIKALMLKETELFTTDVVFGGGNLNSLLVGNYSFMNKPLADFYGIAGPAGDAFERVELNAAQRAGLLTQGSLTAGHANSNQTSPVARGFFVRERFLCAPPPPPPPDLQVMPPEFDPTLSTRERFELHRKDPACAACHQLMDPIGLGFENFDPVGRFRTEDAGKPIDARGELFGTDDIDGPFNGAVELAGKLAASSMTRACMVKQLFRYGYGRGEGDVDSCSLDALNKAFSASNGNIKDLLLRLAQTDTFLYRTNETGATP
jgi:hypothetical protein